MPHLSLTLFGGFQAHLGSGIVLDIATRKAQALLAYLALRPGEVHLRDKVATLLWGDTGDEQARQSLRQTLVALRRALRATKPPVLLTNSETLALNVAAVEVDVAVFERLVGEGTAKALERAAALYHGDLLEGFRTKEAPFEEWLRAERRRLRELAFDALSKLLDNQTKARQSKAAIETATRLLAMDPFQETVHRVLMRLYAGAGRRGEAIRQYQTCADILQRELRTEPEVETKQLHQELLRRPSAASAQPVAAHRFSRLSSIGALPPPASEAGVPEHPLIGREAEHARLRHAFDEARSGRGQVVAILGEAGIGKSRLVHELATTARQHGGQVLVGRCYESEQILPFGPWADVLRRGGLPELSEPLSPDAHWRMELIRLLPELGPATALPAPASQDFLRLFEAMATLLRLVAVRQPTVLILEDLHWADELSLRLFAFLGRRSRAWPLLLVGTAREEELATMPAIRRVLDELEDGGLVQLALPPLSQPETMVLVKRVRSTGGIADAMVGLGRQVWELSEGNPFMVVETMRAVEEGTAPAPPDRLPLAQRIRHVVRARLERLDGRSRQLVAVAAVIGREFEFRLLQRASGMSERDVADTVEELVRRGVVRMRGERFDFTHDWIREVAYTEVLVPRRVLLHAKVAESMEVVYAGNLEVHFAALAYHARGGELWDKAVGYLRAAAAQAAGQGALRQSVDLYEQALELVGRLPEDAESRRRAIDVRLDFHVALFPLGEAGRLIRLHREAELLARTLNDQPRLGRVAYRMGAYSWMNAQYAEGVEYGQQAFRIAATLGDPELRIAAAHVVGVCREALGEYRSAIEHLLLIVDGPDAEFGKRRRGVTIPTYVAGCAWLAMCLAQVGDFKAARVYGDRGVEAADALQHALAQDLAYTLHAIVLLQQGEYAEALPWCERAVRLCDDKGMVLGLSMAYSTCGQALAWLGRVAEALSHLEHGARFQERAGIKTHLSQFYARWAEGLLLAGRGEEAEGVAGEALQAAVASGERGNQARALCLLGEIAALREPRSVDPAIDYYQRATGMATDLGMRPLLAHCDFGLGKLYRRTGMYERADSHFAAATRRYADMEMRFWLAQATAPTQ